jgi:hypothetical protein
LPKNGTIWCSQCEKNVAHHHNIGIALDILEHARQREAGILAIAGEQLLIGLHHASRGIHEPLALRIVAGPGDERAHCRFRLLARRFGARNRLGEGLWRDDFVH